MSTGLWAQYALLAAAVTASIAYMFRKLAPVLAIRCQASLSAALSRPHRAPLVRRLGRLLKPREASGECGSGCGTCSSCGTGSPNLDRANEQPVTFHPSVRERR